MSYVYYRFDTVDEKVIEEFKQEGLKYPCFQAYHYKYVKDTDYYVGHEYIKGILNFDDYFNKFFNGSIKLERLYAKGFKKEINKNAGIWDPGYKYVETEDLTNSEQLKVLHKIKMDPNYIELAKYVIQYQIGTMLRMLSSKEPSYKHIDNGFNKTDYNMMDIINMSISNGGGHSMIDSGGAKEDIWKDDSFLKKLANVELMNKVFDVKKIPVKAYGGARIIKVGNYMYQTKCFTFTNKRLKSFEKQYQEKTTGFYTHTCPECELEWKSDSQNDFCQNVDCAYEKPVVGKMSFKDGIDDSTIGGKYLFHCRQCSKNYTGNSRTLRCPKCNWYNYGNLKHLYRYYYECNYCNYDWYENHYENYSVKIHCPDCNSTDVEEYDRELIE